MPKWISVEEAAAKYGINKEVIWLWADMKRFPMSYEKGITTVDEESLIGFLHQNKDRAYSRVYRHIRGPVYWKDKDLYFIC